jgi:aminoglycoside phosphotransferase (APT) family kinase protein
VFIHTDNIVHSSESLVFLDWQMSGVGRPGSDLAFLNVRAMPAGVTTPPERTARFRTLLRDRKSNVHRRDTAPTRMSHRMPLDPIQGTLNPL